MSVTLLVLLIDRPDRLGRAWRADEDDVGAACARLREAVPGAACVVVRTSTDAPPPRPPGARASRAVTDVVSAFHADAPRLGEIGASDAAHVLVARPAVASVPSDLLRAAVAQAAGDALDLVTLDAVADDVCYVASGTLVRDVLALGVVPGALTLPQAVRRLARAAPEAPLPWRVGTCAAPLPAHHGARVEVPRRPPGVVTWPSAPRDVIVVVPSPYQSGAHFAWLALLEHLDPGRVAFVVARDTLLAGSLARRGFVTMQVDAGWVGVQSADARDWREALAVLRPSVVHMDGAEGAPLMAVARQMHARVVVHVRLLVVDRFLPACAEADVVVAVSAVLHDTLAARLGDAVPVVHVPDGVPVPAQVPPQSMRDDGAVRCLCLGRVEPAKDQLRVIDIVRALAAGGPCALRLVGPCGNDVGYADEVVTRLRALPEGGCGTWVPFTHPVADQYAWADVVLVGSRSEALGMVGLEALAAGRLLVAQRSVGYAEIVDETAGHGLLFDRDDDPGDIATRIRAALASWPAISARAHRAARTHFDARTCAARLTHLWER